MTTDNWIHVLRVGLFGHVAVHGRAGSNIMVVENFDPDGPSR